MSPYEQIYRHYQTHLPAVDFPALIGAHLQYGFCFSTPDFFIMGRPVIKAADPIALTNPRVLFHRTACDTWFIHAFAGSTSRAWSILPWPLEWVAWQRSHLEDTKEDLRFVCLERLRRLCSAT